MYFIVISLLSFRSENNPDQETINDPCSQKTCKPLFPSIEKTINSTMVENIRIPDSFPITQKLKTFDQHTQNSRGKERIMICA